jgi:anti-anti-sigma regulatory factor
MFTIEENRQKRILVLRLTGDVVFDDVPQLMERLEACVLTQGVRVIALDLSRIGTFCLAGIGAIMRTKTVANMGGRRIVLLAPPEYIEKMMDKLDIDGFFQSYYTEAELHGAVAEADAGTGIEREVLSAHKNTPSAPTHQAPTHQATTHQATKHHLTKHQGTKHQATTHHQPHLYRLKSDRS